MATILLKRGTSGTPTGLQTGEPAINLSTHRLFIGGGSPKGYPLGCMSIVYPKRLSTPKMVGDITGTNLTTLTLTANRLYFIPYTVPRGVTLTGLRISVTTAATGTASIGIYENTTISGNSTPGTLLASVTGLDVGTTGDKTGSLSYTLYPGIIYWFCIICNATFPVIRAVPVDSVQATLGRAVNGSNAVSYLYASGSGDTLPSTAPTSLTNGYGAIPGIYILE